MESAGTPDSGRDPGDEDAAAPPVAIVASVARHLPDDSGRLAPPRSAASRFWASWIAAGAIAPGRGSGPEHWASRPARVEFEPCG